MVESGLSNKEEIAGGMSYQIMKGFKTNEIMKYLSGHDVQSSWMILEKNKEYYIASANKIIARFELAKVRIENINIKEKDSQLVNLKLNNGLKWLNNLIKNIKNANNFNKFLEKVPYKQWHAVKLIPSAAEGYAITVSIELKINQLNQFNANVMKLNNINSHNKTTKEIFLALLNLDEKSDFNIAEKQRIKGYEEINLTLGLLKE